MLKDLYKREGNFFESTTMLRAEFNKAVEYFEFKNFTVAICHLMREAVRQYHEDAEVDINELQKELRIEIYGRRTSAPSLHAADLRAASIG